MTTPPYPAPLFDISNGRGQHFLRMRTSFRCIKSTPAHGNTSVSALNRLVLHVPFRDPYTTLLRHKKTAPKTDPTGEELQSAVLHWQDHLRCAGQASDMPANWAVRIEHVLLHAHLLTDIQSRSAFLICDEVSMLSSLNLNRLNARLNACLCDDEPNQPPQGRHVLWQLHGDAGDFYQLPPVAAVAVHTPIRADTDLKRGEPELLAHPTVLALSIHPLKRQVRQSADPAQLHDVPRWPPPGEDIDKVPGTERNKWNAPAKLPLFVGLPVMILKNTDLSAGLVNGSLGKVVGIQWDEREEGRVRQPDVNGINFQVTTSTSVDRRALCNQLGYG